MGKATQGEAKALKDGLAHLEALIAASRGDSSTCTVFDRTFAPKDEVSVREAERLGEAMRCYLQSWVTPAIAAALHSLSGAPDRDDLTLLAYYKRWGA